MHWRTGDHQSSPTVSRLAFPRLASTLALLVLSGCGSSSTNGEKPPAMPVAPGAREALERASLIVEASSSFRKMSEWRDAVGNAASGTANEQRTILATIQEQLSKEPELTKECQRFSALFHKFTALNDQLNAAKKDFAALDPESANYVAFLDTVGQCQQLGVARLADTGKKFADILEIAQDDNSALQRLVPLSSREFFKATRVSPLMSNTTDMGLAKLAHFHANVRNQKAAQEIRLQKTNDKLKSIVATNRAATKDKPLLIDAPNTMASVARNIQERAGTHTVMTWSPRHDAYWEASSRIDPKVIETLRSFGLRFGPQTEFSLRIRVPDSVLTALAGWLKAQRSIVGEKGSLHPLPTKPLFVVTLGDCQRFLTTGNWERAPTIVVQGELVRETALAGSTSTLLSKSIVAAVPPNKKTLVHNRQQLGLSARAIREGKSFPTTLHWPRGSVRFGDIVPGGFSPFQTTVTGLDGASQYLQLLCEADQPRIDNVNKAITDHLRAIISNSRDTISKITMATLEKQLQPLVGAKQSRIDARIIAGAGLRAIQGINRFSQGSGDVFSDGALYRFNIERLDSTISSKGKRFFSDFLLDRTPIVLLTRNGTWLVTVKEAMEILDRVLQTAGFKTQTPAFSDVSTQVKGLSPQISLPPALPLGPPLPELVPPPAGGDALEAWQQFVERTSREYAAALKLHCSKCDNQGYNGNPQWAEFSRNRETWRNTIRKQHQAHANRLLTLEDHLSTRKQNANGWGQFAATAMSQIKARAGRPQSATTENNVPPDKASLFPAIPRVSRRGTGETTAESDQALLKTFSAVDKDRNRELVPGEAFKDSPLFVMARYFDLDGDPQSVSAREWLLIAKATVRQVGEKQRGYEACQFLLAGPEAIKLNHRPRAARGIGQ
ncbi:MAG: hypothetical protein CMJ68_22185 [Planctomycetaceae bacterium]|nr:hypothetical protein [Planctomycetaceae bacterium]|tara:strand:+ start:7357 stop:10044 length:2688 start_codon:yes stop_codon:yes gene_type:complete